VFDPFGSNLTLGITIICIEIEQPRSMVLVACLLCSCKPKGISNIHGKLVIGEDGQMHHVRCKICTKVGCKDKPLVPKLDGLHKHVGRRKCKLPKPKYKVGEFYISVDNQHAKKERIYGTTWPTIVIGQVILLSTIKF